MHTDAHASSTEALPSIVERYVTAQLAGDRREALRLILEEGLQKGMPAADIHLAIIQPAQYEIGRLWQENRISIAQEHLATAISQLVLAHLYQHLPHAPNMGKKVLIACVEGELHDMGPRIVADFLEMHGFDVRLLGANVPTDSLLKMVESERPDVVALSVTMIFHVPAAKNAVAKLRAATSGRIPIVVGGQALQAEPQLMEQVGADGYGASVDELIRAVQSVLEQRSKE